MEESVERPITAIDMPDKIETKNPPADVAHSKEEEEEEEEEKEAKEEKEGSLKDYFVSHQPVHSQGRSLIHQCAAHLHIR